MQQQQLRSPRCFIKKVHNVNLCNIYYRLSAPPPPLLYFMLNHLLARGRFTLHPPCRSSFRVEIQMSGSEHRPLLSNFHRRLTVQFYSSAELNPTEPFLGSKMWRNVLYAMFESIPSEVNKASDTVLHERLMIVSHTVPVYEGQNSRVDRDRNEIARKRDST